jgi:hypothetical protein
MSITERAERLAANLLADRERERPKHDIVACWSCGTTYINRGRHFCSTRCQEWFDAGNPTYEAQCETERKLTGTAPGDFVVVAGPPELEVGSKLYQGLGFSCIPMRRRLQALQQRIREQGIAVLFFGLR